ncbi:hypothetical protein F4818DRAFT_418902 [Hypoxylon cercidicola]|nr:hypothetical protein F4818DRAFT_418902 [Hypoxylon cercidicola]
MGSRLRAIPALPLLKRSRRGCLYQSRVAIVLSQVTSLAIAAGSWRYYSLFITTNFVAAVIYLFFLPETSGKSRKYLVTPLLQTISGKLMSTPREPN